MNSEARTRFILGPVGSGKSTGCMMEIMRRMLQQSPGPDGIRRTRFVIVRQTLGQIKATALKEFDTWVSPIAHYKVSENVIHFNFNDVKSEIHLIPLDDEDDQRRLLSMQITGAWVNEFPEIDPGIFPSLAGRCGRYPSAAEGGCDWHGVIADGNFPTEGSEWHKLFEITQPPNWQVFKQPGGLSDNAENLNWLLQSKETLALPLNAPERIAKGRQYYLDLLGEHSDDWVRRYVHAEYGNDPSGSAVFRESFKSSFHVVDELEPAPGHPLIIGQDFGRDPCSVICQMDHRGRFLLLEEVMAEDIGLELHLSRGLRPALQNARYLGRTMILIGDPAGVQRSTTYEETSFDVLKRAGFMAYPAPTNKIDARLGAVEKFLLQQRDGGPCFVVDRRRCPNIVRAMNGEYRFVRQKSGLLKPVPEKGRASHIMDAVQYAALAADSGAVGMAMSRIGRDRGRASRRPEGRAFSSRAWT